MEIKRNSFDLSFWSNVADKLTDMQISNQLRRGKFITSLAETIIHNTNCMPMDTKSVRPDVKRQSAVSNDRRHFEQKAQLSLR